MDSLVLKESISLSVADILTQNTPVFIKSYGRGSMATASMRGTAPSHTKVTWNGMSLNSPMLGMVDFSYIPAYLVDDAELYHGAGSVGVSGAVWEAPSRSRRVRQTSMVCRFATYRA